MQLFTYRAPRYPSCMRKLVVGNDVVDLSDPRCAGKAQSGRFVARVFDPGEAERIRKSDAPDRTLWLLCAAKEAAFKVVSKILPVPPPFVHTAFQVSVDMTARRRTSGWVDYEGRRIPFLADVRPEWIHALAWWGSATDSAAVQPPSRLRWTVSTVLAALPGDGPHDLTVIRAGHFSDRERGAVHSLASAGVRIAARSGVADALGVPAESLEVVCEGGSIGRMPPRLYQDGAVSAADVSLSHHGGLVAWAAGLPTGTGGS